MAWIGSSISYVLRDFEEAINPGKVVDMKTINN
jgi:MFS family permease